MSETPEDKFQWYGTGPPRRIHPGDPEWLCMEKFEEHGCMEFHNQTGDKTHRCCCGFEWQES